MSDVITKISNSDWRSPCTPVPKSNGFYRFVTDYCKLNAVTKTNFYNFQD